jgi:hypothetical protein
MYIRLLVNLCFSLKLTIPQKQSVKEVCYAAGHLAGILTPGFETLIIDKKMAAM